MSAFRVASVAALVSRPTGPPATLAWPPSLKLLPISAWKPRSLFTTRSRSVAWPPIWKPTLPPVMVQKQGSLQPPPGSRCRMIPCPRLPPTMKPALIMWGMMISPVHLFSSVFGTPPSGMLRISCRTSMLLSMRFSTSPFEGPAAAVTASGPTSRAAVNPTASRRTKRGCMVCCLLEIFTSIANKDADSQSRFQPRAGSAPAGAARGARTARRETGLPGEPCPRRIALRPSPCQPLFGTVRMP